MYFSASEFNVFYVMTSNVFEVGLKSSKTNALWRRAFSFEANGPLIMHDLCDKSLIMHPLDTKMLNCLSDTISKAPAKFQSKWFSGEESALHSAVRMHAE